MSESSFDFHFTTPSTASFASDVPSTVSTDTIFREPPTFDKDYKFTAVLGDLHHKEDVYVFFGSASEPIVLRLLTNLEQANYLRRRRPDLVPKPQPGNPPYNDHNLGTIFEYHYYTSPVFKRQYLLFLISLRQSPAYEELKRLLLNAR
jgi:hypothetical protein